MDENGAEHIQYCDYHQEIADMAASLLAPRRRDQRAAGAKADPRDVADGAGQAFTANGCRVSPRRSRARSSPRRQRIMNYLSVQETALEQAAMATETSFLPDQRGFGTSVRDAVQYAPRRTVNKETEESIHEKMAMPGLFPADAGGHASRRRPKPPTGIMTRTTPYSAAMTARAATWSCLRKSTASRWT